eukprot:COSAG02_NODE_987_length_15443_cov_8.132625_13_plen_111_part_00
MPGTPEKSTKIDKMTVKMTGEMQLSTNSAKSFRRIDRRCAFWKKKISVQRRSETTIHSIMLLRRFHLCNRKSSGCKLMNSASRGDSLQTRSHFHVRKSHQPEIIEEMPRL